MSRPRSPQSPKKDDERFYVAFWCDPQVIKAFSQLAKDNDRSSSAEAALAIRAHLRKCGRWPLPELAEAVACSEEPANG